MRDIYHELVKHETDFKTHDKDDLIAAVDIYASASRSICSVLTLIGNLTLDAMESEGYDNEDAARDLMLVGDALRHLPRLAAALEQCSDTAHFTLRKRRGEVM
ncbi:hypothetical protein RI820_000700 [Pluralibacter gergoviae]|nr:hypothetical protein [Pluralibacter gergoviae]EKZ9513757.1 hypothetical protein [Pluralibacter gergoviae]ELC3015853.1 hypothetical protein [Pluralibacter gergoviae]ELC3020832.1 hypothetical protein [Pluralibacter gergoviae]EMD1657073.1 hypothetical protein [Pluralibacter gergoviae]